MIIYIHICIYALCISITQYIYIYTCFCFVCDHGKHRNAKRYNLVCNLLLFVLCLRLLMFCWSGRGGETDIFHPKLYC